MTAVYDGFIVKNGMVECTTLYSRETLTFPDLNHPRENEKTVKWLVDSMNQFIAHQPVAVRSWISAVYIKTFNRRLPQLPKEASKKPDYNPNKPLSGYMPIAKSYAEKEAYRAAAYIQKAIAPWKVRAGALSRDEERADVATKLTDAAIEISRKYRGETEYQAGIRAMYNELADNCCEAGLVPPSVPEKQGQLSAAQFMARYESAVLRMLCREWYLKKLNRLAAHIRENIYIATGIVNSKSPYISARGLQEWRSSQRNAEAFLNSFILVNEEQDIEMLLADVAAKSISNPEMRRMELMVRAKGLQETADAENMAGYFLTMTAPSRYHRSKGKQWNGSTPKETQARLVEVFALARAQLAKAGINFKGLRTVEPHKDGTPHWHMLFFVGLEQADTALRILKNAFQAEDREELDSENKKSARFKALWLDPAKGDAVAYVAKYIAKNIDPAALPDDDKKDKESGLNAADAIERVNAWKTIHNIRQFQFFGTASVSLWRELRRIKDSVNNAEADAIIQACHRTEDVNGEVLSGADWATFEKLLSDFPVTLAKKEEIAGQYNDEVKKVFGVIFGDGELINTRVGTWEKKRAPARKGADAPPWTRFNNCNPDRNIEVTNNKKPCEGSSTHEPKRASPKISRRN